MRLLRSRLRDSEAGQVLPLIAVFMLVVVAFAGMVIDIGNVYRVQQALQGAGLVVKRRKRGPHRRRRPRRPMIGMLLHIDGSKHQWLNDDR